MSENKSYVSAENEVTYNVGADSNSNVDAKTTNQIYPEVSTDYYCSSNEKTTMSLDSVEVDVGKEKGEGKRADKPYAGMGKEDLMRFADTPFWNRLRMICIVVFFLAWLSLLAAIIGLTITTPRCSSPPRVDWWTHSNFYQIYLRSFIDSDGDGNGDINGVISKLSYLREINIETIVLSSFLKSHDSEVESIKPDIGYDITNYMDVNPLYGSLADFKELVSETHKNGLRLVVDFVPNHTGKKHQWFVLSQNRTPGYENVYVWADCQEDSSPNNWLNIFGNSAWSYQKERTQCYYHNFLRTQPELNLRSATVRDELEKIMKFWLELGVDGFRIVNTKFLYEDYDLRNESKFNDCQSRNAYECLNHDKTTNQHETIALIGKWREFVSSFDLNTPRILITDADTDFNNSIQYYDTEYQKRSNIPINYALSRDMSGCGGLCIQERIDRFIPRNNEIPLSGWMTSNQDISRKTSTIGDKLSKALLMLTTTLPGADFSYYGQEIGLKNGRLNFSVDPYGDENFEWSRDKFRSPMQWSSNSASAGFTNSTKPWLPINNDFISENLTVQFQNESGRDSNLHFYEKLKLLKKSEPVFHYGSFLYCIVDENVFSFVRYYEGKTRFFVSMNFGNKTSSLNYKRAIPLNGVPDEADLVLTTSSNLPITVREGKVELSSITLRPADGLILKWDFTR